MGLIVVGAVLYVLPTLVAALRHHHQLGPIVVIDLLLGWTFIGWVVALAMATSRTDPRPDSEFATDTPEGWKPFIHRLPRDKP